MQEFILPVLAQHKYVSIAPFGTFTLSEDFLTWKAVDQILAHQGFEVSFQSNDQSTSTVFIQQVAHVYQLDYPTALEKTTQYFRDLAQSPSFNITGLGTIRKQGLSHYIFEPAISFQNYLQPVTAQKVIRKEIAHSIKVGENEKTNIEMESFYAEQSKSRHWKWWHSALVITLLTIGYLVFYFFTNQG